MAVPEARGARHGAPAAPAGPGAAGMEWATASASAEPNRQAMLSEGLILHAGKRGERARGAMGKDVTGIWFPGVSVGYAESAKTQDVIKIDSAPDTRAPAQ